ncbi:hypothetical protein PINS_up013107 [Pythium insidiosum]|nr:hypothetical protein PINS_up013107 [Pythium insidiosum]
MQTVGALLLGVLAASLMAHAPLASAQPTRRGSSSGSSGDAGVIHPGTVRPFDPFPTPTPTPTATREQPRPSPTNSSGNGGGGAGGGRASPLDKLERPKPRDGEWHMKPVRVIHARVQSDAPALVDGRFVSAFGKGDVAKGYLSGMDGVNTASVEGALMYVQAEGINAKSRATEERCVRKNKMQHIVFYEILIAQPNETIAEFASAWGQQRDTFEYGPMVPMDGGRCTSVLGGENGVLPDVCLQYNGEQGQPALGPFVGGSIKDDDVRAPYPDTYWFSFPNSCPTKAWAKKTDECRAATRSGLCPLGQAPDGVACTFAYDILGWVPIDDVVGITRLENEATGQRFRNLTEWCEASKMHVEFVGDDKTGEMEDGLKFWQSPLDKKANRARAKRVVEVYNQLVAGEFASPQIDNAALKLFRPLPEPDALRRQNPKCFESVPACNTGAGCRREGYAQLCKPCSGQEEGCEVDAKFKFPTLEKAPRSATKMPKSKRSSVSSSSGSGTEASTGSADSPSPSKSNRDTIIESPQTPVDQTKRPSKTRAPTASDGSSVSRSLPWTLLAAAGSSALLSVSSLLQ